MKIDTSQQFRHLKNAPIVEAVIAVAAKPIKPLEEKPMLDFIKAKMPEYPVQQSSKKIVHELQIKAGRPEQRTFDIGWNGVLCKTNDGLHVVQFNRDGFVFSRLKPYENWDKLKAEALRLWGLYNEVARPGEIQRLGLRYINAIHVPAIGPQTSAILVEPPKPPASLPWPVAGFIDQDTFSIPDHPFVIQIVKTVQPASAPTMQGSTLIVDIDVFTTNILETDVAILEARLDEMRWLKNTAFFGILTDQAIATFI